MLRSVDTDIWVSGLPLARELAEFADVGGKTAIDLTRRPRPVQERACSRARLNYKKIPMSYQGGDYDGAVNEILAAEKPVLFFCFHGRDRSGIVARRTIMRRRGRVVLYRVGRNFNRAYRTCEAFGVSKINLVECRGKCEGNLYSAVGRVDVGDIDALPFGDNVLALETWGDASIEDVDWTNIDTVLVGGETSGLPRSVKCQVAAISQCGNISGLTVEAALAIALHEWRG